MSIENWGIFVSKIVISKTYLPLKIATAIDYKISDLCG